MCILFIYTNSNPEKGGYRAIIASNRDEFYKRPARTAFHCQETHIIGGRDMEPGREGGMWLGISAKPEKFAFGALLNVTGEQHKTGATQGRGPLVYNLLNSQNPAEEFLKKLDVDAISAFNLVTVEIAKGANSIVIHHHSNSPVATIKYTGNQILGFGNSTPVNPLQKVTDGKSEFEKIIEKNQSRDGLVEDLLELLKSEEKHLPDAELQRRAPQNYQELSAICVKIIAGGYGTRTHSIVLVDAEFNVEFIEHTLKEPIDIENPEWVTNEIKARL